MLLKLLGEWGDSAPLCAAVFVSAPVQLDICADHLDDPFMSPEVLPDKDSISPSIQLEVHDNSGHLGFISGHFFNNIQKEFSTKTTLITEYLFSAIRPTVAYPYIVLLPVSLGAQIAY